MCQIRLLGNFVEGQEHIPIEVAIIAFFYPIYSKGRGVLENVSGYLLLKRGLTVESYWSMCFRHMSRYSTMCFRQRH